jgi:hypothetical protein
MIMQDRNKFNIKSRALSLFQPQSFADIVERLDTWREIVERNYDQRNKNKRNSAHANTVFIQNLFEDNDPFIQAFVTSIVTQQDDLKITAFLANTKTINIENMWLFDTGATHHLTHNKSLLHDYI